jgi:hypothetical protein
MNSAHSILFNILLENLGSEIRQKKEMKGIKIEKEKNQ